MLVWSHNSFLRLLKNLPSQIVDWDTGIPVNCWSEGSAIQQCVSWCVLRHHHGFCDYWGRGRFRGASRVGLEMQKSFVWFCGQAGGCYFICEVVVLLCCFLVVLFVLLHLFETTVTLANWQMSFIHIFYVFSNESSYQELLSVCCLAVLVCLTPKSCITWIQLHPGHQNWWMKWCIQGGRMGPYVQIYHIYTLYLHVYIYA